MVFNVFIPIISVNLFIPFFETNLNPNSRNINLITKIVIIRWNISSKSVRNIAVIIPETANRVMAIKMILIALPVRISNVPFLFFNFPFGTQNSPINFFESFTLNSLFSTSPIND